MSNCGQKKDWKKKRQSQDFSLFVRKLIQKHTVRIMFELLINYFEQGGRLMRAGTVLKDRLVDGFCKYICMQMHAYACSYFLPFLFDAV
jgi:hypothetical protein